MYHSHQPWISKSLKFCSLHNYSCSVCSDCLKHTKKGASNGPVWTLGKFQLQPLVTWFSPLQDVEKTLFLWRATKTDALLAVKHPLRASEKNPGEGSVIRAGIKGNPGEQTENKSQSSFSLESLFYSLHRVLPKASLAQAWVQLSPGKHLTQKPSTQTRKVLQIFSKIQSEFNNRKHHVNSALADTTHSAYNSAISAHKLPAAHTEIHWGTRRKNRAALFRGKCEIYHMPFIFCFPFSPCFRLTSAN